MEDVDGILFISEKNVPNIEWKIKETDEYD